MRPLAEQTHLVTGATQGIGKETARALAADLDTLALLRKSLPGEFRKSRMCDAKKFVLSFEVLLAYLTKRSRA